MTPDERARIQLVKRYPEYEIPIGELLARNVPTHYVRETASLARRHHVPAPLLFEIFESMLTRARASEVEE
jgi:hypothetical protein